jgi:tRNA A-37 threonylcarbamoyl transferase component Bud32
MGDNFVAGLVGEVLDGRYRLDALVGEGGMGAVYRAQHLAVERKVAVKLLKPHLTNDDVALQRFAREARATMRVDSPHAVKILDFGVTPQHQCYMVLEYLDGRSVQRELDVDGAFAPPRVLHIARQILHALGAAHRNGIIHRDIKPENVLLLRVGDDPDHAKVLDFGVAKLMEGAARSDRSALALTQVGMVFGTPEYMSPEQACGHQLDGRSDLYSLAATMFAMLTGCAMYNAKSPLDWLTHHATVPPPHLTDVRPELAVYPDLDRFLQRCLAKRREERAPTAEAMAAMLQQLESTLTREPPAADATGRTTGPATGPAVSVYVETLPPQITSTSEALLAARPRRRGVWIAIAALVAMGIVVGTIAIAARPADRAQLVAARDAAATDGGAVTAHEIESDSHRARSQMPPDAAVSADAPVPHPRSNPDIARHLAAAEAAGREHRWLLELEEADAVLTMDRYNARALLLAADAELGSGDLVHGCNYLHALGRDPTARARARQAGCPGD